jgi:phenolic acid decarboxylase
MTTKDITVSKAVIDITVLKASWTYSTVTDIAIIMAIMDDNVTLQTSQSSRQSLLSVTLL